MCICSIINMNCSHAACGTRQEADMMFLADSASAGKKNTKKINNFMKSVTSNVEVGKEAVQAGLMLPEWCYSEGESFR